MKPLFGTTGLKPSLQNGTERRYANDMLAFGRHFTHQSTRPGKFKHRR